MGEENNVTVAPSMGKSLTSLVAGVGAGLVNCVVCAPFDVAKVRLQVQGSLRLSKYSGVFGTLRQIFIEEGIRGSFKGLGPALYTVPLFWGIYWGSYDYLTEDLHQKFPDISPPLMHIFAAILAGGVGDIVTNPFWVVRTRMQTLIMHPEQHINSNISTLSMFQVIYREEGIATFYKGLSASFLGLSHVAIQFPLYEYCKKKARELRGGRENAIDIVISSLIAKLTSSLLTYPHEVLRSRSQDKRAANVNVFTLIRTIIREEGVKSLWSGFPVNLVRLVPATASTFLTYEYVKRYFHDNII